MQIETLINEIIPPDDYQHRNGFNNSQLIDQLNEYDKKLVEESLINKVLAQSGDTLIVETLAYMKSTKSLPFLYNLLKNSTIEMAKIIIATSIFEINEDREMMDIVLSCFEKINKIKDAYYVYRITKVFYYLKKFKDPKTESIIEEYIKHPEYLISYNAKRALNNI